ncbi:lipid IV(A) 3-deoxy-D-manno-octulosonic acid transferase [Marinimicrobium alkaliphilum]|uniref:lipid IV(A) 3-deoxy-D-manno-octulosonic acid transferase n=1 Tax=Marinimicrobium alkaliphilum TaxID=2202654 RepID=UPI000DBAA076|nr:lipid IV(A) 3-deoxy-D-manno-octulosonic acid transferase [Marinimicrobium alkaliphilum]
MRLVYTLLLYLSLPLILLHLLWRTIKAPGYARRLGERFGRVAPEATEKAVVWVHTVSVGEFLAAQPVIRALLQNPDLHLLITTSTPTGSERVLAALGDQVSHTYAPYDTPDSVARFLNRTQPRLLLIMETELWPNTLAACAAREIPVVLMNARLSERSARGYRRVAGLTRGIINSLSLIAAQHESDAARFKALGAPEDKVAVTGSIKFDLALEQSLVARAAELKAVWSAGGERLIWIAASTHLGEDELILEAYRRVRTSGVPGADALLLVLVPRHPERFERVVQLCENQGLRVARRSADTAVTADVEVLVGDTMGELLLLFGASDIAFVGGSLVPNGGHNFIEPAAWGLPLQSGTHLFNFAAVADLLASSGALKTAEGVEALAADTQALLADKEKRRARGAAALKVAEENRGALEKTLALIRRYL